MAIVKHIAIHQSPMRLIRYVMNEGKTDEGKLVTGLSVTPDPAMAYRELQDVFEKYSRERFYKRSLDGKTEDERGKEKVRLHHYIQSFAKGEVTPEQAHQIGVEWARKMFGDNHQVIVSTHTDRSHIHNHFCVAAYDLDGKAWYGNKTTLKRCRQVSDGLCKSHGLSVIEQPKKIRDSKYGEWLARQSGTSWKQKLCDDIDRLILREDVKTVEDLAARLREQGYTATLKKYLSIKAAKNRKAVRSYRLGDGYAIEELRYRIENKDMEMSIAAVASYQGIQREYAMCLRELQIMVYRRSEDSYNATYAELRRNTELLCYLHDHDIHSAEEFERTVNAAAEKTADIKKSVTDMQEQIKTEEKISEDGDRYVELTDIMFPTADTLRELERLDYLSEYNLLTAADVESHRQELARLKAELPRAQEQLAAAEAEKREAARNYKTYLQQMQSDYDFILARLRKEHMCMEYTSEIERAEQEQQRERTEETQEQTRRRYI